jgi:hypothetical protein
LFPADAEPAERGFGTGLYVSCGYGELDFGAPAEGGQADVVRRGEQCPAVVPSGFSVKASRSGGSTASLPPPSEQLWS